MKHTGRVLVLLATVAGAVAAGTALAGTATAAPSEDVPTINRGWDTDTGSPLPPLPLD
jgi:hypothetical protein